MTEFENNPLRQALARTQQAEPHLDSGLLTAFAEGALLERERQNVFAHLATCAQCRELLSAAAVIASDSDTALRPFLVQRSTRPQLRSWLPWASVAAGILLVCSAGVIYRQKLELKQTATVARESGQDLASATHQQPLPSPAVQPESQVSKTVPSPASKQLKAMSPETTTQTEPATTAMPQEVAAPTPTPAQNSVAFANSMTARALSNASIAAIYARPHWRIDSAGQVERAFGEGAWQPVLANESAKMRVVSVFETQVWVGGENTRLYRSSDNGSTWSAISLPLKNNKDHEIIHIRFQTPQAGTVEASDGTAWTTTDGGATWN